FETQSYLMSSFKNYSVLLASWYRHRIGCRRDHSGRGPLPAAARAQEAADPPRAGRRGAAAVRVEWLRPHHAGGCGGGGGGLEEHVLPLLPGQGGRGDRGR